MKTPYFVSGGYVARGGSRLTSHNGWGWWPLFVEPWGQVYISHICSAYKIQGGTLQVLGRPHSFLEGW